MAAPSVAVGTTGMPRTPTPDTPTPVVATVEPPKKQRKVSLGGLLGGRVKKEAVMEGDSPAAPALDELDKYLADAEEPELDVNVLDWWKAKENLWPNLAKMVTPCEKTCRCDPKASR